MAADTFSSQLEAWLDAPGKKTLGGLNDVFQEKTFSIALLLLLIPSSLPLPTGGVTHVLELIALVISLEMIFGLRSVWLPNFLLQRQLGATAEKKTIPFIIRRIRWFERRSKPRLARVVDSRLSLALFGLFFLLYTLGAFLAPPFTGLDTLPSLGVVIMALGVTLSDMALVAVGIIVGAAGIGLIISVSDLAIHFFTRFLT